MNNILIADHYIFYKKYILNFIHHVITPFHFFSLSFNFFFLLNCLEGFLSLFCYRNSLT